MTSDLYESPEELAAPAPRAGTVALVGRPNAGKSTLMNLLLREKVAIISDKPQTTRNRLVGILTEARGQMVFYDTPGVHRPQHRMNRGMVKAAQEALNDADAICLLVDVSQPHGKGDAFMLEWVSGRSSGAQGDWAPAPRVVLLNKIDRIAKPSLLPRIALYAKAGFEEIVPISALKGDGTDRLLDVLWPLLPEAPAIYDPELLTIHPERFLVAERIREKILERTRDELPFSVAVVIDDWQDRDGGVPSEGGQRKVVAIYASILVERGGQRSILLGSGGQRIKAIGTAARRDLEPYLERRVYLDLKVRVEKNWRENPRILSHLDRAPFDVTLD